MTIGEWTPSDAYQNNYGTPMEWDVTDNYTAAGRAHVKFQYTKGVYGLDVLSVVLLENGIEIAREVKTGFTTNGKSADYTLDLPAPSEGRQP